MKAKWIVLGFCLFALAAISTGFFIAHQKTPHPPADSRQVFQVNGVVQRFEDNGKTVVIAHDDIPDFMPAMTMPFTVKDATQLKEIHPGDAVQFELVVTKEDSWISEIQKRPGAEQRVAMIGDGVQGFSFTKTAPLDIGNIVPDFTLTNQDNRAFHLADYRGKAVLLTFIYARCPLPNYCPLMSKNFSELQKRLGKDFAGKFHLITVTFDPEHDTPAVLKRYADAFTQDESSWTFATGTKSEVASVASEFGLVYLPEADSFTHDLRTALIAPDGRLIHVWRSNVWTPYEVERWAAEILDPQQRATNFAAATAGANSNLQPRD